MSTRFHLTTVPLKHQLDIPTLQITLFVNNEDESKVFQLLNELDNKLYHNDVVKMLKNLLKKIYFMFIKHFMIQQKF